MRGVLFDVDGTLIDHDGASATALLRALEATPDLVPPHPEAVGRRWRELEETAMRRYLAGDVTFAQQRRLRVAALAAELGSGAWDDRRVDAWFDGYLRHYEAAWRTYDDVWPALRALAAQHPDLRLGVLTNGDADQQSRKLQATGLATVFPVVVASSAVGAAKPDPRIFRHGAALLRLAPAEVVYVGDRLDTDAVAATRFGMLGVWLNRDNDPRPVDGPAIHTLDELPALLREVRGRAG